MPTHYDVLDVAPDADAATIEAAYKQLVRRYHPDINPAPQATEWMQQINAAHTVLSSPGSRRAYDHQLGRRQAVAVASDDPHMVFAAAWDELYPIVQLTEWHPVGGLYQVDFALPAERIAVDVDASTGDPERWQVLDAAGWQVLAFNRVQVLENPLECAQTVYEALGSAALRQADPEGFARAQREQLELESMLREFTTAVREERASTITIPPFDRLSALYGACSAVIGLAVGIVRSNVRYTESGTSQWLGWWSWALLFAALGGAAAAIVRRRSGLWLQRGQQVVAALAAAGLLVIVLFSHLSILGWLTLPAVLALGAAVAIGSSNLLGNWLDVRR